MGFVRVTLQLTGSKGSTQYVHNLADVDLMPCVLLCRLSIWEAITIRVVVVQRGPVLTEATC